MKLLSGIAIYFCVYLSLFGQKTFDIIPNVGGLKEQGQGWTLLPDSNHFYVLGDLLDASINGVETIIPWLGKADYNGEVFSYKWIVDTPTVYPFRVARNSIFKNSQNRILIYGSQRLSKNSVRPKLIEYNLGTGKIDKSVYINNPIDSSLQLTRKLMLIEDSLIILTNYFWIENHYKLYIVFLDRSMNVLSSFILSDGERNNFVYYIERDTDSTLTLIGDTRLASDESYFPEKKPFITRVSNNGTIIEHKVLSEISERTFGFGLAYANTVKKDENNNWIISCLSTVKTNLCQFCHYIIPYTFSITSDFNHINWITKFESFAPNKNEQPLVTSLVKCPDNSGYITSGFDSYSFLYKVNNTGDSIWLRKYIPIGWSDERALWTEFVDLKATPFNTYLLTGRVSDNELGIIRPWIIQVDSVGCLIPGCDSKVGLKDPFLTKQNLFSIYPNPSTGQIFISNRYEGSLDLELTLSSMNGQVLKHSVFKSNQGEEYYLSLNNIPPGIYLINIFEKEKGLIDTEKLIIE